MKTNDVHIPVNNNMDRQTFENVEATAISIDTRVASGENIADIEASFHAGGRFWLEAARPYIKAFKT